MSINITIPNLPKFQSALRKAPQSAEKEIKKALALSIFSIEREAKQLTPVDTGRLRASLGGGSFKGGSFATGKNIKIEKDRASIGSHVKYAVSVHSRTPFLAAGAMRAKKSIDGFFKDAIDNVFNKIARESK